MNGYSCEYHDNRQVRWWWEPWGSGAGHGSHYEVTIMVSSFSEDEGHKESSRKSAITQLQKGRRQAAWPSNDRTLEQKGKANGWQSGE